MASVAARSEVRDPGVTGPGRQWLLGGIVAVAAGLRFGLLAQQSLWLDEAFTYALVVQPFGDMLSGITETETSPPLSYVFTWVSTRILGDGEFGMRFVPALAGTAAVPVAFLVGRELRSGAAGLWAAALVAVNPLLFWFSEESRSYALLALLTAVGLLFFLRALDPAAGRRGTALAGWAIASALALATHYFAAIPIAVQGAWLLWTERSRLGAGLWIALGGVALAAAALLPLVLDQRNTGSPEAFGQPLAERLAQVPKQFLVGYDGPGQNLLTLLSAALLMVAALGLWRHLRSGGSGLPVVAIAALAICVPAAAALVGVDYLNTRNLIGGLTYILVLAGVGLAAAPGRLGAAAGALLVAIGLVTVVGVAAEPVYQRTAWRSLDGAVGESAEQRLLVMSPGEAPIALRPYRADLAPATGAGVPVREIVVAGLAEKSSAGATATPPDADGRAPPAPGFRLVDRRETSTYTLLRYRSEAPVTVAPATLAASRLDDSYAVLRLPPSR